MRFAVLALALAVAVAVTPSAVAEPVATSAADCQGPIDTNCYDENSRIPDCYLYVVVLCIPDPI